MVFDRLSQHYEHHLGALGVVDNSPGGMRLVQYHWPEFTSVATLGLPSTSVTAVHLQELVCAVRAEQVELAPHLVHALLEKSQRTDHGTIHHSVNRYARSPRAGTKIS